MVQTAISVIIPAYRVESFISECLDSLEHQDFQLPFQVILVDCDSPDRTGEICRQYAQRRPDLFFYYHYDFNRGVSVGRNIGLFHASGKYISFLDGDDFVSPDYLSELYRHALHTKSQVVTGGYYLYSGKRKRRGYSRLRFCGTGKEALLKLYHSPQMKIRTFSWGRLYERSFLNEHQIRFDERVERFEDWIFFSRVLLYAERVLFFKKPLYYYRQHDASLMASAKQTLLPHLFAIETSREDAFKENEQYCKKLFDRPHLTMTWQLRFDADKSYRAMNLTKHQARKLAKKKLNEIFDGRKKR